MSAHDTPAPVTGETTDAGEGESQQDVIDRLVPSCVCPEDLCLGESGDCAVCQQIDPEWDCLQAFATPDADDASTGAVEYGVFGSQDIANALGGIGPDDASMGEVGALAKALYEQIEWGGCAGASWGRAGSGIRAHWTQAAERLLASDRCASRVSAAATRAAEAEAEVSNLSADLDRCEERLWRLAAKAGHVPTESDNNATAELVIADALDAATRAADDRAERIAQAIEDEREKWEARFPVPEGWDLDYILRRDGTYSGLDRASRLARTTP